MKKLFSLIFVTLGIVSLVSCNKEVDQPNVSKSAIKIVAKTENPTKATLTDDYDVNKVFNGAWEPGDEITVEYGSGVYADAAWTVKGSSAAFVGDDIIAGENLYAYFPKGKAGYTYSSSDRKQKGNAYNSAYDVMYSDKFSIEADEDEVEVMMHRATAIQYFHLTADDSAAWASKKVNSATLEVTGTNACIASSYITLDGTGVILADDVVNSITISFEDGTAPTATDVQLWFNVLPCEVESMTITVNLEGGYSWTKTNNFSGKGYTFQAGKLGYVKGTPAYVAPAEFEKVTSTTIESGLYAIVSYDDAYYLPNSVASSNAPTAKAIADGELMYSSDILWNITVTTDGKLNIESAATAGVYLWGGSANDGVRVNKTSAKANATKEWYLKSTDSYGVVLYNKATTEDRYLSTYATNDWRNYTSTSTTNRAAILYKFNGEVPTISVTGVTLDLTDKALYVGESFTLKAVVSPSEAANQNVTWSSSNESVAKVENGLVTAKGAGTSTIKVTTDDGGFEAVCTVTVTEIAKLSTIAEIKNTLKDGTSTSLKVFDANLNNAVVTYVNGNNVFIEDESAGILYYKSGHSYKAGDVLSGNMSGNGYSFNGVVEIVEFTTSPSVADGTAPSPEVVTLAQLNSNFDSYDSRYVKIENVTIGDALTADNRSSTVTQGEISFSLYAKVNGAVLIAADSYGDIVCIPSYNKENKQIGVWETSQFEAKTAPVVNVSGVSLDKTSAEVEVGKTVSLVATITPSNATNKNVTWMSNHPEYATVANGVITGVAEGEAIITVTTVDGEKTATCTVSVTAPTEEVYKTALFGSSYNSKGVSSYTGSFSATNDDFTVNLSNFNNNNNGWDYVKTGNKTNTSVGTIATASVIDKAITKVVVTVDAITISSVNSISLSVINGDGTEENKLSVDPSTGELTFKIENPTENRKYSISFDCKKGSSNGIVTVSKVEYYALVED